MQYIKFLLLLIILSGQSLSMSIDILEPSGCIEEKVKNYMELRLSKINKFLNKDFYVKNIQRNHESIYNENIFNSKEIYIIERMANSIKKDYCELFEALNSYHVDIMNLLQQEQFKIISLYKMHLNNAISDDAFIHIHSELYMINDFMHYEMVVFEQSNFIMDFIKNYFLYFNTLSAYFSNNGFARFQNYLERNNFHFNSNARVRFVDIVSVLPQSRSSIVSSDVNADVNSETYALHLSWFLANQLLECKNTHYDYMCKCVMNAEGIDLRILTHQLFKVFTLINLDYQDIKYPQLRKQLFPIEKKMFGENHAINIFLQCREAMNKLQKSKLRELHTLWLKSIVSILSCYN